MRDPHNVNTKDSREVAKEARRIFGLMGATDSFPLLDRIFTDVDRMFTGRYPGLQAIDMQFHDFEHTLQATVCLLHILEGRHRAKAQPPLSKRDCELAVMSVLLHDSGYLKDAGDTEGTGAKYTLVHVRRSCMVAKAYLSECDVTPGEIEDISSAISCTGPENRIIKTPFRRPEARLIACILVTADYLGQMSAPDYVAKLPILFSEFYEAYDHDNVAERKRTFHSAQELIEKTPSFWEQYVRPMLDHSLDSMYRFADSPDGTNPFIATVDANIAEVRRKVATKA